MPSHICHMPSIYNLGLSNVDFACMQGCDICLEDRQGRSGVHLASMKGHANIIHCLTQRGMELDAVDYLGKTPAHYAARHGSVECLEVLAKNSVDLDTGTDIHCIVLSLHK